MATIETAISENNAAFSSLQGKFLSSVSQFESVINSTIGANYDLDRWLNAVPTPSLGVATIPAAQIIDRSADLPAVPPPSFIPPETAKILSTTAYDSIYLEEMETGIRLLTANLLNTVLPPALYEAYFVTERAEKARAVADQTLAVLQEQATRGFPSLPMRATRLVADGVETWQKGELKAGDEVASQRLDLAKKLYFATIAKGVNIEQIRSKLLNQYAAFFSQHNQTLAATYRQLMEEKLAAARLAFDNTQAQIELARSNVALQEQDNRAEIELPSEILQRALKRAEQEFSIDSEMVERRSKAMQKICETYAGWVIGNLGQTQGIRIARHNVTVTDTP